MFHFMGLQFGNCDYKLQQIIQDTDANRRLAQLSGLGGKPVQKTSDILFRVVADVGNGVLYIPVSKLDFEMNKTVVPSQLLACYSGRTRALLKKTPSGTATIPFGGILQR